MAHQTSHHVWPRIATIAIGAVLIAWLGLAWVFRAPPVAPAPGAAAGDAFVVPPLALHPVRVGVPAGPPRTVVGAHPQTGEPLTASCTTCHATRAADPTHGFLNTPDAFHQGLVFDHGAGALGCLSCHNPDDYDTLRLASGDALPYPQVMSMCAQCHTEQHTDYLHGAHGGMTGYWDRSRGPRTRHSCIGCHDPHAPAYPKMRPTFKPIDRGLNDTAAGHPAEHAHE